MSTPDIPESSRAPAPAPEAFAFRPVDPAADGELLHRWVSHPKAAYWMMRDLTREDVEREYAAIAAHPHHDAFVGELAGRPAFLMERYDPRYVELVGLYEPEPGDVGMHFLVPPAETPVHGYTRAVITAVMRELFADPDTVRVVVEPDVRNAAVHALNAAVGFETVREIAKPEKDALLSVCTRKQFEDAVGAAR